MIANFFGKSKPINIIAVISIFLFYYLFFVFTDRIVFEPLGILNIFIILGITNIITIKYSLTHYNSYAFLIFVLLMGVFPETFSLTSTLYTNLILLFVLRRSFSLKLKKNLFKKVFDSGILIGVSFIIEPLSIFFIIISLTAIYLHQQLTLRLLLISIVGFLIPLFLCFTYYFWFDKINDFYQLIWRDNIGLDFVFPQENKIFILLIVVFVLTSILIKTSKVISINDSFRNNWLLLILNFVISFSIILLTENKNGSELFYIIFPSAIIIANGIELCSKKWISNTIILFFFMLPIVANFL